MVEPDDFHGMIYVHEISARTVWRNWNVRSNKTIHLPNLGLVVAAYYRPGRASSLDTPTPECTAFLEAVQRTFQPLIDLDATPWLYDHGWFDEIDDARMTPITKPK
jgi:hypothetical protein